MPQFDLNFEFGGQTTETGVRSRGKRASDGEDKCKAQTGCRTKSLHLQLFFNSRSTGIEKYEIS